ncbi:DUF3795 domain-containing protein [Planctomycetota bacterium]
MGGKAAMKGWTEEEWTDKRLMAPCGPYCGTRGVYIATRDGNTKFRDILAKLYGSKPADTVCKGRMQEDPPECLYSYCRSCRIRECVRKRGFYSCHQCSDFPCSYVTRFPLSVDRKVMRWAIPRWRELVSDHGDEEGRVRWAQSECERYHCSGCGHPLFRGATAARAVSERWRLSCTGRRGTSRRSCSC